MASRSVNRTGDAKPNLNVNTVWVHMMFAMDPNRPKAFGSNTNGFGPAWSYLHNDLWQKIIHRKVWNIILRCSRYMDYRKDQGWKVGKYLAVSGERPNVSNIDFCNSSPQLCTRFHNMQPTRAIVMNCLLFVLLWINAWYFDRNT